MTLKSINADGNSSLFQLLAFRTSYLSLEMSFHITSLLTSGPSRKQCLFFLEKERPSRERNNFHLQKRKPIPKMISFLFFPKIISELFLFSPTQNEHTGDLVVRKPYNSWQDFNSWDNVSPYVQRDIIFHLLCQWDLHPTTLCIWIGVPTFSSRIIFCCKYL